MTFPPLSFAKSNRLAEANISLKTQALASAKAVVEDGKLGFWQLPKRPKLIEESMEAGAWLRRHGPGLFLFGIGGSSLGPQLINELYGKKEDGVAICDNVDPDYLDRMFESPDKWKTGSILIISKSGGTLETLAGVQRFHALMGHQKDWMKRALVITEAKPSPLRDWATANQVRAIDFPQDVGGRFSVLSPVGMVVASYLGQDVKEFMAGGQWAVEADDLVAETMAQFLLSFHRQEWVTSFWTYSSMLRSLGPWLVQLWAESLAKARTVDGEPGPRVSTPVACLGASDQHSVIQQVMEGYKDKFVVIHRVISNSKQGPLGEEILFKGTDYLKGQSLGSLLHAEANATAVALRTQDIHVLEFDLADLSPRSVGALLMFWERVVAGLGIRLRINPFDQPGVELGKRLAIEYLQS